MGTMRRRWRPFLGIAVVVGAIVICQFVSNTGIQVGVTLIAVFIVIILIISGNRPGGGRINPWHTNSGSRGGNWT